MRGFVLSAMVIPTVIRTAIDTSALAALWSKEPLAAQIAGLLGEARGEGGLVVSAPVYAELLAHPKATEAFVATSSRIRALSSILTWVGRFGWMQAFDLHATCGGADAPHPKRLPADFIIGAHATLKADRLMTLDQDRYRRDFPELTVISSE